MGKSRILLLILTLIAIPVMGLYNASASCGGSWFNSSCESNSPYQVSGNPLDEGLKSTKGAVGTTLSDKAISVYAQDIVKYLMGFISLIAVIYIIYGGFQVLVGGGDEEKMKKTKNIIIYVIVGIVIMWLALPIVKWTIGLIGATGNLGYEFRMVPQASAAYTESSNDTFAEYKDKIRASIEGMESEFRVNGSVSVSTIQNVKNLVQEGANRLPDIAENESAKRNVDMFLDLAIKNPTSNTHISNALSNVGNFIERTKIYRIEGDISASPAEGYAPLSVSFRATGVKDPSGTTPSDSNYIWWIRENGGYRRELKRGPSMSFTFDREGNYTVFLDVVSGSKNKKGRTDVLPLSISKQITVKPKLGEIILLVNGVNVTNLNTLKISPAIGQMGLILDASASRAIGNGTISETKWDFGNGNQSVNVGGPIVERQIYANKGGYELQFSMKTNDGEILKKQLQILVIDPSAVIQLDQKTGHIGEDISMSAKSYLSDNKNVEYSWQIQDEDGKRVVKTGDGLNFRYKFDKVGTYIISLNAKNPNGQVDTDSKTITIESRDPIVNLDTPRAIQPEKPNTLVFDASKSYDPDTNSKKNLQYVWYIDGSKVDLDAVENDGSKGSYTFNEKGTHTVRVDVSNAYGKITNTEKTFEVTSLLSVNLIVTPKVVKLGNPISFISQSPNAEFFDWNMGDGSPIVSGNSKNTQYTYKRAGIYNVTLNVNSNAGTETNSVTRKVYVADGDNPLAIINVSNTSNTAVEEPNACGDKSAYVINRADSTTFDGSSSINVDGTTSGVSYTWKYLGNTKTTNSINEKFGELGCFPIELTVRSGKNGATNTATQYIKLVNKVPEFTSITTSMEAAKKDSQKILVKVTANGARDPDGVITSYIWYYKTDSDQEPQNIQITQKNEITFVLPNITEKYTFGVILEDNDGARVDSMESGQAPASLSIANADGNIYLPLISLVTPKTTVNVGEKIGFSVDAKTIVGTNITSKAEYAWDFDGDGRMDITKSSTPNIDHVYTRSGDYNMKVRVTYNGVSNTKYQTIHVKNKLKAAIQGYKLPDGRIYLLNSSDGAYDKTTWSIGSETYNTPTSIVVDPSDATTAKLEISSNNNEIANTELSLATVETIATGSGIAYQSYPKAINDTITIKNPGDTVSLSLYGNTADNYAIDTDTSIDTIINGNTEDDADNMDTPSYKDGSVYVIEGLGNNQKRERRIRLALIKNGSVVQSKNITLILDFIQNSPETEVSLSGSGIAGLSTFDQTRLDDLSSIIRSLDNEDRLVLMKQYNILVENWQNTFDKAKSLIDIQEYVDGSSTMSTENKDKIGKTIDDLLIGDSKNIDEIGIAVKLIRDLIPKESPNNQTLLNKLAEIESHPTLLKENKKLGQEMLSIIQNDATIPDKYKIHIKNQLIIIVNGGSESVPATTSEGSGTTSGSEKSIMSNGFFGFVSGFVKIFFIIIAVIIGIGLIGFIFYRVSRKDENIGFQDFLIDSVFHSKHNSPPKTVAPTPVAPVVSPKVDPLSSFVAPTTTVSPPPVTQPQKVDPLSSFNSTVNTPTPSYQPPAPLDEQKIPDWLKVPSAPTATTSTTPVTPASIDPTPSTPLYDPLSSAVTDTSPVSSPAASNTLPDWLKPTSIGGQENTSGVSPSIDTTPSYTPQELNTPVAPEATESIESIPDWLKPPVVQPTDSLDTMAPENVSNDPLSRNENNHDASAENALPDWLVDSLKQSEGENTDTSTPLIETPSTSTMGSLLDMAGTTTEVSESETQANSATQNPKKQNKEKSRENQNPQRNNKENKGQNPQSSNNTPSTKKLEKSQNQQKQNNQAPADQAPASDDLPSWLK